MNSINYCVRCGESSEVDETIERRSEELFNEILCDDCAEKVERSLEEIESESEGGAYKDDMLSWQSTR